MNLMTVALAMMLGADAVTGGSASIILSSVSTDTDPGAFPLGSYALPFENAFVAQGSYSGLWLTFKTDAEPENHHEMTLFIPSHEQFSVRYESRKGEFTLAAPERPFTIRTEASADVQDLFGRPRPLKIELSHWLKVRSDNWSQTSVEFTDCKIEVEALHIEEHALTFAGSFECRTEHPPYTASGRFTVDGGKLGVSKVD